jgi:hypothetical protein
MWHPLWKHFRAFLLFLRRGPVGDGVQKLIPQHGTPPGAFAFCTEQGRPVREPLKKLLLLSSVRSGAEQAAEKGLNSGNEDKTQNAGAKQAAKKAALQIKAVKTSLRG